MNEEPREHFDADEAEPVPSKLVRIIGRVGILVSGVIWLSVVGTIASIVLSMAWSQLRKPLYYVPVQSVVTQYTREHTTTDDFGEETFHPTEIVYAYEVNGQSYTGTGSRLHQADDSTFDPAAPVLVGTQIKAWYDPGEPSISTLEPIAAPQVLGFLMFLMPFLAVGAGMVFFGLTGKGPKFRVARRRTSSRGRGMTVSGGGPYFTTLTLVSVVGAVAFLLVGSLLPWQLGWLVGVAMLVAGIPLLTWRIGGYFKRRSKRKAEADGRSEPRRAKTAPGALPRMGKKLAGMVGVTLFWCGITGVFLGLALHSLLKHRDAQRRFHTVEGEVIASKVKEESGEDGSTYKPLVKYRYAVDGVEYTSMRYSYSTWSSSGGSWANSVVRKHPAGQKVTVYYDPDEPSEALLHLDVPSMSYFLLLFMQPFVTVGLGLIAYTISIPINHARSRAFVSEPSVLPESIPGWGSARREMGGWTIRGGLAWYAPFVALAGGYGLTCFVSIFVVLLGFGGPEELEPRIALYAMAIAGGVGLLALVYALLKRTRKANLFVDSQLRKFSLTGPNRDVNLRFDDIAGWTVRTIRDPMGKSVNDVPCTRPLLLLTATDGQEHPVHVFGTHDAAPSVAWKVGEALAEITGAEFIGDDEGLWDEEESSEVPASISGAFRAVVAQTRRFKEARKKYRGIM